MNSFAIVWGLDNRIENPTFFVARNGNVVVLMGLDRISGQEGVAVVAVGVNSISPIGELRPKAICKEFIMRLVGPLFCEEL
jgi:hypothetical protein